MRDAIDRTQPQIARIDAHHSNILDGFPTDVDWPDASQWASLHARDELHEESLPTVVSGSTEATFAIELAQPGVVRVRLAPGPTADDGPAVHEKEGPR